MSKIYVASSWRNDYYDLVLGNLIRAGHEVWNWRKPPTGGAGFRWQDCGLENYKHGDKISPAAWRDLLANPIAQTGFAADLTGMNWCDIGVLLHPCGKSAHLEAGWIAGRGKTVYICGMEEVEPDLMVLALNGKICDGIVELLQAIAG